MVVSVGIDVSKDKHDCFILNSEGEILSDVFTIPNSLDGFTILLQRIRDCSSSQDNIKVGLEATGHYSYNILGFLLDNGLPTYVLNPLRTNLYRKSLSLRKTKTDRVDARTIAAMLLSDAGLKPYTDTVYHNEELKSLTRYRFDKVKERAKLKSSVSRLVCILFPELEKLTPTLHMPSVYALLDEFPGAKQIAEANLTHLKAILHNASKGRYNRDKAIDIRESARASIGAVMSAKSLELRHTIRLIRELDAEIEDIEAAIQSIMNEMHSPITTIPGIGTRMGAMILAEVGDFPALIPRTSCWHMLVCPRLPTNLGNLRTAIPIWRSAVPDTCAMRFTTPPSMSAYGPQPLLHTLQKSGRRANITTLRFLTLPRSWCGLFLLWRNPGSRTARQRKFLLIASTGVLTSSCFAIPFLNHLPFYHIHSFLGLTLNS